MQRPVRQTDEFLALRRALEGRYSIASELGQGAMGVVYLAHDIALDRPVAIKLLRPELATRTNVRSRFLSEARTAARLSHPNIVPIYLVEDRDDLVFFVMAFIEGETLGELVGRQGPLSVEAATRLIQETAWAVGYAHAHGVVHRDVKPDNILIERGTGRAIVTDFGIALRNTDTGVTSPGEVLGTPHFVSPEQAAGERVDARSDIYSLGITAFFALAGRLPFDAPTTQQVFAMHVTQAPPDLSALCPEAPRSLIRVVMQCLNKDPADRPASGEVLAQKLAATQSYHVPKPAEIVAFEDIAQSTGQRLTLLAPLSGIVVYAIEAIERVGVADSFLILWVVWVVIAELVIQPVRLIAAGRRILRAGISYEELKETIRARDDRRVQQAESLPPNSMRRRILYGSAALLAAALALTIAVVTGPGGHRLGLRSLGVTGVIFAVGFLGAALLSAWGAAGGGALMHQSIWAGSFGRGFFRVAGFGMTSTAPKRPTALPLDTGLVKIARAILASLPESDRRQLAGVVKLIDGLEARAGASRQRVQAIEIALSDLRLRSGRWESEPSVVKQVGSHAAVTNRRRAAEQELEQALVRAGEELTRAVADLEMVHVDLVRLRAGVGSVSDLLHTMKLAGEGHDESKSSHAPGARSGEVGVATEIER